MKGNVLMTEWAAFQSDVRRITWRSGGDAYPKTRKEAVRMACDFYGDGIHPAKWADLKKQGVRVAKVNVVEV